MTTVIVPFPAPAGWGGLTIILLLRPAHGIGKGKLVEFGGHERD